MSYDLFFYSSPKEKADPRSLLEYFGRRPNYRIEAHQAIYENPNSGVYFIWDIGIRNGDPTKAPVDDQDAQLDPRGEPAAQLILNYLRPHIFGLEAEPEVTAFVETFHLPLHDPQVGGMGDGPYSRDGFLNGWNKGNQVAYKTFVADPAFRSGGEIHSLPREQINRFWKWNLGVPALQKSLGDSVFVPSIFFLAEGGSVRSFVIWVDAIPAALPEVDLFLIPREDLAPRRLWVFKSPDKVLAKPEEVYPLLEQYPPVEAPLRYRLLNYSALPTGLGEYVSSLPAITGKLGGVPVDRVLDEEEISAAVSS